MSRVLLISHNRCQNPDPVFPLGLAHLAGALRARGYQTRWHDPLVHTAPVEEVAIEYRPDHIGISLRNIDDVLIRKKDTFFRDLAQLCASLRRSVSCPITLGGSGYSIFPAELFQLSGVDYGVAGAGEAAFPALLEALDSHGDLSGIPGLVWRRNGHVATNLATNGAAPLPLSAADTPEDVMAHYLRTGGILNVQTQRGCAFRCCYCTYPLIEGRNHQRRSAEEIAADFAYAQRRGARYVFIVDSVFNSSASHVHQVCEALLRQNQRLSWGCFLRPQGLTHELVRLMARAGLAHAEFGCDSFADEVLAAYQKGLTFDDILHSNSLACREKVDTCHFLICGGPGETRETLAQTFERSKQLSGAVIMAVVGMRIYPGTALHARAIAEGRISRDSSLLLPEYYVANGLTAETVFTALSDFAAQSPNWIVGDPTPEYTSLVRRLRQRGVAGPLWSYFSMLQRLGSSLPGVPQPSRRPVPA